MIYKNLPHLPVIDIDLLKQEYEEYLKNLPSAEEEKFKLITKYPKIYLVYRIEVYCKINKFNLFGLKTGIQGCWPPAPFDVLINTDIGRYEEDSHCQRLVKFLQNTPFINGALYLNINKGAVITHHTHPLPELITHTLLEDIKDGYFEMQCENHSYRVSKKGEKFSFDGRKPHGGLCTGTNALFFGYSTDITNL